MNLMDIVFILLFFGLLAAGFFQGMVRIFVLMVAFYLALVLASLYYPALGEFLVRNFGTQRFVGQYVAFAMVLLIGFLTLAVAGLYTFRYFQMPGGLQYLDYIGGTLLGLVFGALIVGILASLLYNLMIVRGGRNIDLPVFGMFGNAVASSFVMNYFGNTVLPITYTFLDPILPEGADLLFRVQ